MRIDELETEVSRLREALLRSATDLEVTATFWIPGLQTNLRNPYARRIFDTLRCEAARLRAEASKTIDAE